MQLEMVMTGPLQENCYVVMDEDTHEAIIVDPGADAPMIGARVAQMGAQPIAVVNTHCHFDHVGAVTAMRQQYNIPFYIHPQDRLMLERASVSAKNFGLTLDQPAVDRFLREGEPFKVGHSSLEVRFTPGHCPGHVALVGDSFALVGDVLFAGSIGRYDLPGASLPVLLNSIKTQLLTLPDETVVLPGHGPSTTIGRERRTNPFLQNI
ncbi:MAG: MBL fold metallo-hydrolase [Chloroflexi bacterium]|nr:MBL fold metallo-hydrolase [Chloroflexota bacterium]